MIELTTTPMVTAFLISITFLISIVGFFVVKVLNKVDKIDTIIVALELIKSKLTSFDSSINYVHHVKEDLKDHLEDIIILKRNEKTIWSQIDRINSKVGLSQ